MNLDFEKFQSEFIGNVKGVLKDLGLKAKDFNIHSTNSRRYGSGYGSTVYTWYDIKFKDMDISGGDPWEGKFNTYAKYSYIYTALNTLHPDIHKLLDKDIKDEEKYKVILSFNENIINLVENKEISKDILKNVNKSLNNLLKISEHIDVINKTKERLV